MPSVHETVHDNTNKQQAAKQQIVAGDMGLMLKI